jgi:tRNA modification GTPase
VIVTEIPGTTRDVIEESINLDGLPVVIWDTAGIRETGDQIERLGVELSRQYLERADLAIVVFDGSEKFTAGDLALLRLVNDKKHLVVINKYDLPLSFSADDVKCHGREAEIVFVSATTGVGIDRLKSTLREQLLNHQVEPEVVVTNIRHRSGLLRSAESLELGANAIESGLPPELAAVNLNEAREALEEIVGIINNENILEHIFSNFCIGK